MSPKISSAATRLLANARDDSGASVAACAAHAFEQLTKHMAQWLGEAGVRALLTRSAALASARYPWIASTVAPVSPANAPWAALRSAMERQEPREIRDAFTLLLASFVELLERLIGEQLAGRLLHDVWPEVFQQTAEEVT